MTTGIDPSLLLSNYQPAQKQTGKSTLGKDDFLKILIAQLQHQDPLNPMEDREFIAQMASFSTLEQMVNMSKMMEEFIESQSSQSLARYSEMIGKRIEWNGENDDTNSAIVKAVVQKGTEIMLELDSGETISASSVTKVTL
jgi:flagellar basal-body rod modification protein FlgD